MVVWGGADDAGNYLATRRRLRSCRRHVDVDVDRGPTGRAHRAHTAAWAGARMIVWGGFDQNGLLRNDGEPL